MTNNIIPGHAEIDLLSSESCIYVIVRMPDENGRTRKYEYPMLCKYVSELQLSRGFADEYLVEKIQEYSEISCAYFKACRLLGYSACSIAGLRRKLREKGFSAEASHIAVNMVCDMGLIDEEAFATREAELCLDKYWGERRIISKLREKGFGAAAISSVSDFLLFYDFNKRCLHTARKRFGKKPLGREDFSRAYGCLARLGYSGSQINYALKILSDGDYDEFSDDE